MSGDCQIVGDLSSDIREYSCRRAFPLDRFSREVGGARCGACAIINKPLRQRPGPQVLDQVNVGMARRAALNPPVLDVAGSTVEVGGLEAVRGNNHLCTATSPRLSLCRRKQSAPQASTAQVSADPQEFYVAATSPRPTRQPRFEASVTSPLRSAQQSSVVEPRRVDVELVDAIRESGGESVVVVTDGDGIVGHDCMMTGLRRPRAVRRRMLGRTAPPRSASSSFHEREPGAIWRVHHDIRESARRCLLGPYGAFRPRCHRLRRSTPGACQHHPCGRGPTLPPGRP